MNSNKKRKRLLIVSSVLFVTIFLIVFIINYSFAGIKTYRLNIPKSTCIDKDLPPLEQGSSCEERVYLEKISEEYSLEDLYEIWGAFNDDQQEFIINYLNDIDSIKGKELNDLIENIKSKKIVNTIDGNEVTVITEIPRNTSIEVEKTDKDKLNIIEDLDVGIVDNNSYVESYTYDISMNNNKSNYVENEALITISDIKADKNKKYFVYHLLDSVEAINDYKDNDNLIEVDSNKFTGDFSKELQAAKKYSNADNRIYVVVEEANINNNGSISFSTNSFSTFHVVGYTVDFHYNNKTYSINGESSVLLSQIFEALEINKDVSKISTIAFSNEELISVAKLDNDWMLTSSQPFDTDEVLTLYFDDGEMFTLRVTDDANWTMFENASSYFKGGEAVYKITGNSGAGKAKWNLHIMLDAYGSQSPDSRSEVDSVSDTANNLKSGGTQYKLVSPTFWFYSKKDSGIGSIENGDNGVNDINMKNMGLTDGTKLNIDVYAIPTLIYSGTYGNLRQASGHSLDYQYRTVKYYINEEDNDHLITEWSGIMPDRGNGSSNNCGLYNGEYRGDANMLKGTYNTNYLPPLGDGCNGSGVYDGFKVTELNETKYYFSLTDYSCRNMDWDNRIFIIKIFAKIHVKYNANGGTGEMANQEFVHNQLQNLTSNAFARDGYTFNGWNTQSNGTGNSYSNNAYISFNIPVENAGSTYNLYAMWLGNPQDYTVNHYKQNLDGTYTLDSTETISGKRVGDTTAATAKSYTGYTVQPFNQVEIGVNGATVNIYYNRNTYNYTIYHKDISAGQEIAAATTGSATYGSTITVKDYVKTYANSGLIGYYFTNSLDSLSNSTINISTDPASNVATIYYYYYERNYKVAYYTRDLDGSSYTKYGNDVTLSGPIHGVATYDVIDIPGFHYTMVAEGDTQTSNPIQIPETGLLIIRIFYDRNSYNISYSYSGTVPDGAPTLPDSVSALYGSTLELPIIELAGYDFSWNQNSPITVSDNMNIIGTFTPKNDAFYRVRYYLKGTNTEIKNMDENSSAEYNKEYSIDAPTITGFTLDDTSPKTVTAGYAGSNNEISFSYTANLVDYTVNRCLENLNGNNCTSQSETLQGYSLDPISYQQSDIEGFTFDHVENNSNGTINPDGSTIVTVYYSRNSHNIITCITKDDDNTYNNCQSTSYMYGEAIVPLTNPSENYYNFSGWVIETPDLDSLPNTMPDHDINVSGILERKKEDLTIIADWGNNVIGKTATFTVVDSDNNNLEVITNNTGRAIVKGLGVNKTYTITEVNCDIGYTCGNYITHTMVEGNNTITFTNTLIPTNKSWLKSENRNKNVFGVIQ